MAWELANKQGLEDISKWVLGKPSFQFALGDMITVLSAPNSGAGIGQWSAATDYPYGILVAVETRADKIRPATDFATTTWGERLQLIPLAGTGLIAQCDVTPLINNVSCNLNSTATTNLSTVIFADASGASANAYIGSTVYCAACVTQFGNTSASSQLADRIVTASTTSGGVTTLTVVPPFPLAPSNRNNPATQEVVSTVSLVPYATGTNKVKLDATNPQQRVSVALADVGGGHIEISGVDLARNKVACRIPQLAAV